MISQAVARQMSDERAHQAALDGEVPYLIMDWDIETLKKGGIARIPQFPNLGTHCPDSWKRVDLGKFNLPRHGLYMGDNEGHGAFMVDSSGWDEPGAPAMSINELIERVLKIGKGYGYALVQCGEFQVKVGVFAPKTKRVTYE